MNIIEILCLHFTMVIVPHSLTAQFPREMQAHLQSLRALRKDAQKLYVAQNLRDS